MSALPHFVLLCHQPMSALLHFVLLCHRPMSDMLSFVLFYHQLMLDLQNLVLLCYQSISDLLIVLFYHQPMSDLQSCILFNLAKFFLYSVIILCQTEKLVLQLCGKNFFSVQFFFLASSSVVPRICKCFYFKTLSNKYL